MLINDLICKCDCKRLTRDSAQVSFNQVYIGDLLSFVMGHASESSLWLTIQGHLNIVAVAKIKDFSGVVICEGVKVSSEVIEKAEEEGISLFSYEGSLYELASKLSNVL